MFVVRAVGIGLVALIAAGCQQSKSANPLSPDIAGPIPGVSITAPKPLEPAVGQTLETTQQPFRFLIENASTSGVRPLFLQFQLSSDSGFQTIVHNADRIDPGPNGRTSYTMNVALTTAGTYYWRSRSFDGANTGPWSAAASFALAEPVIIETPIPIAPIGQIDTITPQFVVRNGRISGPAGPVIYRFEVATLPDPGAVAAVLSTSVGSGSTTTLASGSAAPFATTLYWRAYATNGAIESPRSAWAAFRTPNAPTATPPPPTGGGTGGGGGGGTVGAARSIDINEVLAIVRAVHDGTGADLGSRSSRDSRNRFFASAIAAVHFGHGRYNPRGPDSGWCIKDGGSGRPQSDDVAVRCNSRDAWDLIGGAGANGYSFHTDYIGRLPGDQNVYPPPRSALP